MVINEKFELDLKPLLSNLDLMLISRVNLPSSLALYAYSRAQIGANSKLIRT